jgi:fermentation-respiration switch protein FrsA (DUF1100 family)
LFAALTNRLIYYPIRYPEGDWSGSQTRLRAQDRYLTARDNVRIHAWWMESPGAPLATLFLHGNAGNITHRELHAHEITAAGSSLLLLDFRGYGRSDGSPTEPGLYADADAAYDSLIAAGYTSGRIIVHGESLGTAVAVDLGTRRPCAGLILEAPLRSVSAIAAGILPVLGPALVHGFDSEAKIAKIRAPLLVIHGTQDDIVPYSHGQAIFAAAPEPKSFWSVEGAHHNDLIVEAAARGYRSRLRDFYRNLH